MQRIGQDTRTTQPAKQKSKDDSLDSDHQPLQYIKDREVTHCGSTSLDASRIALVLSGEPEAVRPPWIGNLDLKDLPFGRVIDFMLSLPVRDIPHDKTMIVRIGDDKPPSFVQRDCILDPFKTMLDNPS